MMCVTNLPSGFICCRYALHGSSEAHAAELEERAEVVALAEDELAERQAVLQEVRREGQSRHVT